MIRILIALIATLGLVQGCATVDLDTRQRLDALLPADILLLGEQHDADEHQRLQRAVVQELARRGQLAALALEMAPEGRSTRALAADVEERGHPA